MVIVRHLTLTNEGRKITKLPEESQEEQIKTWRTAVSKFISTWVPTVVDKIAFEKKKIFLYY